MPAIDGIGPGQSKKLGNSMQGFYEGGRDSPTWATALQGLPRLGRPASLVEDSPWPAIHSSRAPPVHRLWLDAGHIDTPQGVPT